MADLTYADVVDQGSCIAYLRQQEAAGNQYAGRYADLVEARGVEGAVDVLQEFVEMMSLIADGAKSLRPQT